MDVGDGYQLWVETPGDPSAPPLLLVMGANASGLEWPDALVDRLAEHHRVVRYDHRDTGRSTHAFDERPYALRDLARDLLAVLDALGVDRAHAVGMSLGGTLLQVQLVDHPERFLSATILGTPALDDHEAPGPLPELLEVWAEMGRDRPPAEEHEWQLRHARLLHGPDLPFDAAEHEERERRIAEHRGTPSAATAHARADQRGLERDTSAIVVPVLVVDALADPVAPPPTAERLASRVPLARRVVVPGMGHALPAAVVGPLAAAVLEHTARY
ncbi:alpha/beta fold hydrolase [Nocardioides sp. ChNu-99]|uniref:alpha/beta fold hydrolase n=1 Tax=Nocardioides sp. ChNu-99 TaxID=2839897 RepID=UPI002405FD55|nr:alpha/beta fold hydrolase [Nocardioides sp. ChNu-99]MDF9716431.1 alpha/beta fold hydrolase [Nocardioides sp. ChNu-99]